MHFSGRNFTGWGSEGVNNHFASSCEADGTLEFKNELNDFCSCHDIVQGNVILVVWMKAGLMQ